MRTGRPPAKRTPQALSRDIATMRRLRASLIRDTTLSPSEVRASVESLDKAIAELQRLSSRICA